MRLVVVVAVLAQLSLAWADDPVRDQEKAAADGLAKDAHRQQDVQKLLDCGQAYVDLYNKNPTADDFEELLFNGAQCYDDARSLGPAIMLYRMVTQYSGGKGPWVAASLARLAALFQQIGMLEQAADNFEKLATSHAGDKGAKEGLIEAIRIRELLEQPDKQIAATTQFIRQYGAKDIARAAELSLALAAAHHRINPFDAIKHQRDFVKAFDKAGDELVARAYAELGEALWSHACSTITPVDGLCIKVTRDRPLPVPPRKTKPTPNAARCGATTTRIDVLARDAKLVAEAMAAFAEAEKRYARIAKPSVDDQRRRAMVRLAIADRELEAFLALSSTDRSQATAATKQLWDARSKAATATSAAYTALAGELPIPAAARLGTLWHVFATQLGSADIPATLRGTDAATYCDKLDELAATFSKRAIDAYDACLAKSSQLGVIDRWTRQCERERGAISPTTYAPTQELLPEVPLRMPVLEELAIRPRAGQRQSYKDALAQLAKVIDQQTATRSIPAPQCAAIAKAFEDVAKIDPQAEIHVMAGLTYGRCNQLAKARAAYATGLKLDPKHPLALSNLAELEYRAGNLDAARKQWEAAIAVNARLFGARLGLAALELRTMQSATGAARTKPASEALVHAANAAATSPTSSTPFLAMAIITYHQAQLPLARYFATRAAALKGGPEVDLVHAVALAAAGDAGAIAALERAKSADDGALALAIHQLALHRYADAAITLAPIAIKSYELAIARGIAARGQGKLADAEARYADAIAIDPARPEAHFNLGVLHKDYTAARATDPAIARAALKKAAAAFRKAATPAAKALADDCDQALRLL